MYNCNRSWVCSISYDSGPCNSVMNTPSFHEKRTLATFCHSRNARCLCLKHARQLPHFWIAWHITNKFHMKVGLVSNSILVTQPWHRIRPNRHLWIIHFMMVFLCPDKLLKAVSSMQWLVIPSYCLRQSCFGFSRQIIYFSCEVKYILTTSCILVHPHQVTITMLNVVALNMFHLIKILLL